MRSEANDWLTVEEAARYLRVKTRTLLLWARQGKVSGFVLSGTKRNNSSADRESQGPPTVKAIVEQYRLEKMPKRCSTSRGYESWLRNHILPRWGRYPLIEAQPREVELWLAELQLAPKSRAHIRGLLRKLWDFAMWARLIPIERNPMELVTVYGASKRRKKPRSLTVEEFQKFCKELEDPFRTLALVCVCFGLRISEALVLKWAMWTGSRPRCRSSVASWARSWTR